MMTPWERDPWNISPGRPDGLAVFEIDGAKIGLVICHDVEFPLISRALAETGTQIIVASSNTETEHGYWRFVPGARHGHWRITCIPAHSPTVGAASWCPPVEMNVGAAGVFTASDHGFPAGGVLAIGEMNRPQWVYAEVDMELLAHVRNTGGVQTYNHWSEQPGAAVLSKAKKYR